MKIDVFCSVIDNYGDIAVVWRLAKSLLGVSKSDLFVRIFVDDLKTFHSLQPSVNPALSVQTLRWGDVTNRNHIIEIFDSNRLDLIPESVLHGADVLIEAFGVRTSERYLELFRTGASTKKKVILHLEYLTAESWAAEYHLLPSPQPWPNVEKYFFVPGFVEGSGGVFIDPEFENKRMEAGIRGSDERVSFRQRVFEKWGIPFDNRTFVATIFSYEHNFQNLFEDWVEFWNGGGNLKFDRAVFVTFEGRMKVGMLSAWQETHKLRSDLPIELKILDFVSQSDYDDLILAGDFHVVRGEESWMRAVLGARAHQWHAYLQPEGYQSVKVDAYLDAIQPFFAEDARGAQDLFDAVKREFILFNRRTSNDELEVAHERYLAFFENLDRLEAIWSKLSSDFAKNKDLSRLMLDFLARTCV